MDLAIVEVRSEAPRVGDVPLRDLRHGKRGGRDERGLRKAGTYGGRKSKLKPQGKGKKGKRR